MKFLWLLGYIAAGVMTADEADEVWALMVNRVVPLKPSTAHAEVMTILEAVRNRGQEG